MNELIACCGLDCETCDARIATLNDDQALREKTAKLWSELNQVEITPEMINCLGCRCAGQKTYFCSDLCEIRKCVLGKGYETCGDCPDLDECPTVQPIVSTNAEAKARLKG